MSMNETLLANLFFIITGSAVLVVGAFLCLLCYHLIRITKKARTMLDRTEAYGEVLMDDVNALRGHIVEHIANGNIFGKILTMVVGALTMGHTKRPPPRKRKDSISEE